MAKVIKNFRIDLSNMAAAGATRQFSVVGDNGAIFSLEVKNQDGKYYNFSTNTFTTTYNRLKNKKVAGGSYNGSIVFPLDADTDDPNQYDINLFAESAYDTVHTKYSEVRFGDGSLDINSSTGSNSNLLQKVIYQYDDVTVTLSAISPLATYRSTGNFVSMVISGESIVVGRGNTTGKRAFSVTATLAATKAVQITRQPVIGDLSTAIAMTMGSGVTIPGEDIWVGDVRDSDTTNGTVSNGTAVTMDAAVSGKMKVGDRVTGTGIASTSVVTVAATPSTYVFTASENVTIGDGITLAFTPPYYHRWSIASSGSIHKLLPGTRMFTADATIEEQIIGDYKTTTTYTTIVHDADGSIEEVENIATDFSVPALDTIGLKPTITDGLVSKQLGYITFNDQVINDLNAISAKFISYGPDAIRKVHSTKIKLTDLKVELTAPTTTTTEATSAHATIAVADREGVINNISTVSGIGIDSSVADPTLTTGGGLDGAGDWVMNATQTLENGITLTVGGTSRIATITGYIEFIEVGDSSFTLSFDVENFLSAS